LWLGGGGGGLSLTKKREKSAKFESDKIREIEGPWKLEKNIGFSTSAITEKPDTILEERIFSWKKRLDIERGKM